MCMGILWDGIIDAFSSWWIVSNRRDFEEMFKKQPVAVVSLEFSSIFICSQIFGNFPKQAIKPRISLITWTAS